VRVQLSAGRGPAEVVAFLADLSEAFSAWVDDEGGTIGPATWSSTRRSVRFDVDGVGLTDWLGTHELVDPVRGRGRRRRWFVDLRRLDDGPAPGPFDPDAIRFHAARAGGPGGQHVNTTASAVRAVYVPMGWEVRVASERSQHRNRAEAVRRLRDRHQEALAERAAARAQRAWSAHDQLQRGDAVRSWRRRRRELVPV